ncbi:hypothetical protein L209DRAFT_760338 [Thermothelomyces heterothallicus CBS 203.75]
MRSGMRNSPTVLVAILFLALQMSSFVRFRVPNGRLKEATLNLLDAPCPPALPWPPRNGAYSTTERHSPRSRVLGQERVGERSQPKHDPKDGRTW